LAVLDLLADKGADVSYHDPFVRTAQIGGRERGSVGLDDETIEAADVVLILTPHPQIDLDEVVGSARLVFDARGATASVQRAHVERL
jgi:UDP-N-acetyl-D-mannosaminuronate dehydrogenase